MKFIIALAVAVLYAGQAWAASDFALLRGPARVQEAKNCTTGWNPYGKSFVGSFAMPASASSVQHVTIGLERNNTSQTFTLRAKKFADNKSKPVTATRLFMPLNTYPAQINIVQPEAWLITPATQKVKLYAHVKGWDNDPTCEIHFVLDLAKVPDTPSVPTWVPTDSTGAPADLYVDRVNGRFFWNRKEYRTLIDLQAALGATVTNDRDWSFPWTNSAVTVMAEAYVAERTGGIVRNIIQIDDGTTANRLFIRKSAAAGLGAQVVTKNAVLMGTETRVLTLGQTFRIAVAFGRNAGYVSQDGEAVKPDTAMLLPAVTRFRVGNNSAGTAATTDELWKLAVWSRPLGSDEVRNIAGLRPAIWGEGDSYVGGAGDVSLMESLAYQGSRAVSNKGVGGSTLASQADRIEARAASYPGVPFVHWDGDPNSFAADIETDLANYARIVRAVGSDRFIIVPPLPRGGQTGVQRQRTRDLTTRLKQIYGARVVDALPLVMALADRQTDAADIAAKVCPRSLLQDGVHLKQSAMDYVAAKGVLPALAPWIPPEGNPLDNPYDTAG